MAEKLWTVVVQTTRIDGREKHFVDRVYKGLKGEHSYSNDSSWDCKEHAHRRKAEIIRKEML